MHLLYIIITESGIIKTASKDYEVAIRRVGGNPEEVENETFDVEGVTFYILSTTAEEWEKTLRSTEVDSIFELNNKIILEHTNGEVYELEVMSLLKRIDKQDTRDRWEKALGVNKRVEDDFDFDIESMITNKEV